MSDAVPVITLDGPGGAGKGTICLLLADKLGWNMLDSGSLYRLTALESLRKNASDDAQLAEIAKNMDIVYLPDGARLTSALNPGPYMGRVRVRPERNWRWRQDSASPRSSHRASSVWPFLAYSVANRSL